VGIKITKNTEKRVLEGETGGKRLARGVDPAGSRPWKMAITKERVGNDEAKDSFNASAQSEKRKHGTEYTGG
jgi:hypothetical protein